MMEARNIAALALALALSAFAGSAPAQDPGQLGQLPDRNWEARCLMTSRIFHRLAEQRTGGADQKAAVFRVSQWAAKVGEVGSHVKIDYHKAVEAAGQFVYARKDLNKLTLAHYGYRTCALNYAFRDDPLRQEAAEMLMLEAAAACQKEHPADRHNPMLRDCVQRKADAVEARVRTARIKVKE